MGVLKLITQALGIMMREGMLLPARSQPSPKPLKREAPASEGLNGHKHCYKHLYHYMPYLYMCLLCFYVTSVRASYAGRCMRCASTCRDAAGEGADGGRRMMAGASSFYRK